MAGLTVPFGALTGADLVVDAVYEGGTAGNAGDDPISRLVPVGNGEVSVDEPAAAAIRWPCSIRASPTQIGPTT